MSYELVQFEDKELTSASVHAHGNFRVGQVKESEIINLVKLSSPNEIESTIESFLSSGSRIVVINTDMCLPVTRYMFSATLLKLSQWSPSYRRVIVREYDSTLYLARRAFWNGKRLPIEFTPEISQKIKNTFESTSGNVLKHVPRKRYRYELPCWIEEPSESMIEEWATQAELQLLVQTLVNMNEPSIKVTHVAA